MFVLSKIVGADGGGRTHTISLSRDFESRASANSTTSAYKIKMFNKMIDLFGKMCHNIIVAINFEYNSTFQK